MINEVKYNGITTVPSDNISPDGDTSMLLNLVPEDGALKPVLPPSLVMSLEENRHIIYIHKTSAFTHYIIHHTGSNELSWTLDGKTIADLPWTSDGKTVILDLHILGISVLYQVVSIGNTLVALTDAGMFYWLWKGEATKYLFLGNDIPELPISFGLQGEMQSTDVFEIGFDAINYEIKKGKDGKEYSSWYEFSDNNKKNVTAQVLAKVNKFIADRSTNKGKFIYPFFVRYAYRLYDGNLIKHSAPILMVCSTNCAPIVVWHRIHGKKHYDAADISIVGMLHSLDYAVVNKSELDLLKNWSDIVKSVDIFISKPIYTYNQNGECDKFYNYDEYGEDIWGYSICKHVNQTASETIYPLRYQMKSMGLLYQMTYDKDHPFNRRGGILGLPRKDTAAVKEEIRNCSQFYLLKSIKIEDLNTIRTKVDIEEDYLQSLVTREAMTDDYDSHDKLIAKYAFSYNARINITNIKKRLFQGFNAASLLTFTDGFMELDFTGKANPKFDRKFDMCVYIYIKQDGKDIIVKGDAGTFGYDSRRLFLYYPNKNAYKAVFKFPNNENVPLMVSLEPHALLNGAFYFDGWGRGNATIEFPHESSDEQRTIDIPNKIYTSEINNPFYYPLRGINTVGTGNIIGICSAVKALSEGQFGQFPLYAFTTEGVWALEVSNTGTYTARQPITRDVCTNAKSLTQIDSAVLFATERGIMLLQGSQTMCISDVLNGSNAMPVTALPKIEKILSFAELPQGALTIYPFMQFIKDCRMIYDYEHQRIIVYNTDKQLKCNYAYIFSLKSKQWGMMQSDIADHINSYPESLAVLNDGSLVNFSDETDETYKNILISRPLKLDANEIHKSIDTVIQRGTFRKGHVQSILYASNDLLNWVPVWSSVDHYLRGFRGTPYKYFRMVLRSHLSKDEGITGCTVQFTPRLNNQPR